MTQNLPLQNNKNCEIKLENIFIKDQIKYLERKIEDLSIVHNKIKNDLEFNKSKVQNKLDDIQSFNINKFL